MKIQVLDNLLGDVNRLFIAGSRFANNDSRLEKHIPIFLKMGEKAPVMKKLAEQTQKLINSDADISADVLEETGVLLYSVMYTQGDTDADFDLPEYSEKTERPRRFPPTDLPSSHIKRVKEALTVSKQGRAVVIRDAFELNMYNDARLYCSYSRALDDKSAEIAEICANGIIPAIGADMIPYLLRDFDPEGKKSAAKRFALLDSLGYGKIAELADLCLNNSASPEVTAAAIRSLWRNQAHEAYLLETAKSKKKTLKSAALTALVKMGSADGSAIMLETLGSPDSDIYKIASEASKFANDETLPKILDLIRAKIADAEYVREMLKTLRNRKTEAVRDFYEEFRGSLAVSDYFDFAYDAREFYSKEKIYEIFRPFYLNNTLENIDALIKSGYDIDERWYYAVLEKENWRDALLVLEERGKVSDEFYRNALAFLEKHAEKNAQAFCRSMRNIINKGRITDEKSDIIADVIYMVHKNEKMHGDPRVGAKYSDSFLLNIIVFYVNKIPAKLHQDLENIIRNKYERKN